MTKHKDGGNLGKADSGRGLAQDKGGKQNYQKGHQTTVSFDRPPPKPPAGKK